MDTGWVKHKKALHTGEMNEIQHSWIVENEVRFISDKVSEGTGVLRREGTGHV